MKTIVIVVISLILFLPILAAAESAPDTEWEKNVGGNREDIFYDMVETSDGGYIAAGSTLSLKSVDEAYVVKFDSSGNVEWEKTYGGFKKDYAKSIRQTSDGGYIVGGGTYSFNVGVVDYYILKLDSTGNVQWEKTYGGSQTDICEAIIQTRDGGYMAAGQSWMSFLDGNIYLLKLDSSGNKEWDKTIGGGLEDGAYDIQQTSDGGYIVAGNSRSATDGSYNMYVVKTDPTGSVVWTSDFGGNNDDQAYSIEQERNGYIAAGYTRSLTSQADIFVVKMDQNGKKQWEKYYGGADTDEEAYSIKKTSDGGYVVTGKTSQYTNGAYDALLMKIDSDGKEEWSQVFGGENNDMGYSGQQTRDRRYVLAGQTKSLGYGGDGYMVKTGIPGASVSKKDGNDVPDYGSPANGILFSLSVLILTGFALKRRS